MMILCGFLILLIALLPTLFKKSILFTLLSILGSIVLLVAYGQILLSGKTLDSTLLLPSVLGETTFALNPLSAFFGLIFALGFPFGLFYGHHYLKAHPAKGISSHQFFLGIMMLSMHFILIAKSSLFFMFGWEMMSLASFFAILQDRSNRETIANALYYFVMMHIGAAFLVAGFALLYGQTGSLNISGVPIQGWAKWLLLIGFAFKAGFFPFYSWLPKAHPVAPAHLSGMMSGMMIKTGVFGIIVVLSQSSLQLFEIVILLAITLVTAFNGIVHALAETNIKRALAYSSIENIGIIGVGLVFWQLGLLQGNSLMATLGLAGALLHCLNHSLFKPMLFYLSGNILVATHTLEIDALGGLSRKMPKTGLLFLIGTLAISAMPLLNGFVSELGIFLSIVSGYNALSLSATLSAVAAGAGLAIVSALALIAFAKVYSIVFLGAERTDTARNASELPSGMLISPAIIAVLCLVLGVFARLGLYTILPLAGMFSLDVAVLTGFSNTLNGITVISLILIIIFAVVYLGKRLLHKRRVASTWGCGYANPSPRMQYTGSAFINPLSYFLKPLLYRSSDKHIVDGYFPIKLQYEEEVLDYVDKGIIQFICRAVKRFYHIFDRIHNGRTNSYITYLMLALLAILIWVLGVSK